MSQIAVRWATRHVLYEPQWGKWHATEKDNESMTLCGVPVLIFQVDGSPQWREDLANITCKRCANILIRTNITHHDFGKGGAA